MPSGFIILRYHADTSDAAAHVISLPPSFIFAIDAAFQPSASPLSLFFSDIRFADAFSHFAAAYAAAAITLIL